MIYWYWLIPAFIIGGSIGVMLLALVSANEEN